MKRLKLTLCFSLLIHASLTLAQTCNPNIIADAPDSRYTMKMNGTVLDKKTALTWMRCALGQTWHNGKCTGSAQRYKWRFALLAAKNTVFAGNRDWRMPNIKELQSLVENHCYDPTINLTAFPNSNNDTWYWSSSPVADHSRDAWSISFNHGYDAWSINVSDHYVRLVRSGQ